MLPLRQYLMYRNATMSDSFSTWYIATVPAVFPVLPTAKPQNCFRKKSGGSSILHVLKPLFFDTKDEINPKKYDW